VLGADVMCQSKIPLGLGHVEIDGLKEPAADEPLAQIPEHAIVCLLPLLHMKDNVGVIHLEMFGDAQ